MSRNNTDNASSNIDEINMISRKKLGRMILVFKL